MFLPITAKIGDSCALYTCYFADNGKKKRSAVRSVFSCHDTARHRRDKSALLSRKPQEQRPPCDQAFAFFHASTLALLIWVSFSAVYLDSAPPLV